MFKKMKITVFLLMIGLSTAYGESSDKHLFDLSDKSCRDVYNSSYLKLSNHVNEFNNIHIKKGTFISKVLAIDTFIASKRLLCVIITPNTNKKCVEIYKKRFKILRDEINISSILLENQLEIDRDIIETIQAEFNTLFMKLKCGDF